ncbi:ArsR/SmtB family transcription factor [Pseudoroseomonas globiformis]|uniref:ArsR/SmtB family transcription factor n=1 Tax=Teichococcus globiformis TaxID=2307229 RepID=A0ABV7G2L6_9PROT
MQDPYPHPELTAVTLAEALAALADPVRLRILCALSCGAERGWGDFDLPIAPSTLSHHLKVLRGAGLVCQRRQGTRCQVMLRSEFEVRFPGLLHAVLRQAQTSPEVDPRP